MYQDLLPDNTYFSRAFSSFGGIGSPEQDWGCALWAGRPGPFFVCSFFRHFARRFWNQTCNNKKIMFNLYIGLIRIH
jgi:hypothetical protein